MLIKMGQLKRVLTEIFCRMCWEISSSESTRCRCVQGYICCAEIHMSYVFYERAVTRWYRSYHSLWAERYYFNNWMRVDKWPGDLVTITSFYWYFMSSIKCSLLYLISTSEFAEFFFQTTYKQFMQSQELTF